MKNKVISLILIIPLVLMFCVFSAANLATLKVPIAVNGVTIFHESQEIINLAETNEFQINAQVMPRNATNKALKYVPESVNGKNFPNLSIDENGLVKASGYGTAKITVSTIDGAYKKSFLLEVTSTLATDLNISLSEATEIFVGDEFVLNAKVVPNESLDKSVKFASSNTNVVRINELKGKCNDISSGIVTLTSTLDNGLNGKIEKSIDVIVLPSASSSLITFNGKQNFSDKIFTDDYKDKLIIEVNFTSFHELWLTLNSNDIILQYDKSTIETVSPLTEIKDDNQNTEGIYKYKLDLEGLKGDFYLKASLNYEGYINYYSDITLEKVVDLEDIDINLNGFKDYIKKNETILFNVEVLPEDFTEYKINPYFTNNNSNNIQLWHISGNQFQIKGLEVGINTLNVEILVEEEIEVDGQIVVVDKVIKTFNKNIEVLNPPTTFNLFANSQKHGLEELLTIGNEEIVYEEEVVKEKYVVKNHTFN